MPRQGIMLCYPFTWKRFEAWGSCAWAQPKLNGDRNPVVIDSDGKVTMYTSERNVRVSLPHINRQLESLSGWFAGIELDGEAYCHGMGRGTMRSINGRTVNLHPDHKKMDLYLFDIISDKPQEERFNKLEGLSSLIKKCPDIYLVPTILVSSQKDVEEFLVQCMQDGYEGIVLRQRGNKYEDKHSTQMMKLKPRKKDKYKIIGVEEEISIHGEPKGALGAFICVSKDGIPFNVGTGQVLTRAGREYWWKHSPIGKYLVVKYQELSEKKKLPVPPVAFEIKEN